MSILGAESLTRRRFAAGARGADGRYVEGSATDTPLQGSVQPMPAARIATLPEGERSRDWRVVYTYTPLRVTDAAAGVSADHVLVDGAAYEVRGLAVWRGVLPHYEAQCVRVQEVEP